ncbi:hypothetical protein [Mucilaginibacter gynuensis]|uniref:hypothetical protein n=1 Tax=Mucilaginibacter gynuensis TaxID=1302236 RepID=UPI0031E9AD33
MKSTLFIKPVLLLLVSGLLLTSLTPILARYYPFPDSVKGFLTGMGLMLEVLALSRIRRKKKLFCTTS